MGASFSLRSRASGTDLVRRNDETTVAISRLCRAARKIESIGTNRGRYARYCDIEIAALVVASVVVAVLSVELAVSLAGTIEGASADWIMTVLDVDVRPFWSVAR